MRRIPITFVMQQEATSTTTFIIQSTKLKPHGVLVIEGISVMNADTAGKVVDVGVIRGGKRMWAETLTLTTAGVYYPSWGTMYVPSDWRIAVNCRSPNDGDKYTVNVFGYVEFDDSPDR